MKKHYIKIETYFYKKHKVFCEVFGKKLIVMLYKIVK